MTTKAQERKALEQIKKIVEGLGENSYIGMAFEGCFEMAQENIDNDWGCSMKQRAESAERRVAELTQEVKEFRDALNKTEQRAEERERYLQEDCDALNERIRKLREDKFAAQHEALNERKEVTIGTTDGDEECKQFAQVKYINHNGFRFVNIIENSGWTTSYKLDDITKLEIQ